MSVNKHLPTKEEMMKMFADVEIRCLDIETTGLSKTKDHVIELGMVYLNCGVITREGNRIFGGGKSAPQALQTHGITDESRAGLKTFAENAKHFKDVVESSAKNPKGKEIPVIFVGHNSDKFDLPFLMHKCREAGRPVLKKDICIP